MSIEQNKAVVRPEAPQAGDVVERVDNRVDSLRAALADLRGHVPLCVDDVHRTEAAHVVGVRGSRRGDQASPGPCRQLDGKAPSTTGCTHDEDRVPLPGVDCVDKGDRHPGWKWSEHVGRALGQSSCQIEHVGMVVSGRNRITMDDGSAIDVGPGDLFVVPPGHDGEVIGDEPYVSLHFLGASAYAR